MVVSAVPGEGKSVTADQLARAIASTGKRTILVDTDLRRPLDDQNGLADILRGTILPEEAMIIGERRNLLYLGRGHVRDDSAEMIAQPRMGRLLQALRQYADVVILDTPNCTQRADALFLAPHVDSILQVVGMGRVTEAEIQQTCVSLAAARPGQISFFLNYSAEPSPALEMAPRLTGERPPSKSREEMILEDNRTTEFMVHDIPGSAPVIRLSTPQGNIESHEVHSDA